MSMVQRRFRKTIVAGLALLALIVAVGTTPAIAQVQGLPERLTDAEFWRMVTDFSEQSGTFPSENFLSNEVNYQWVIPELQRTVMPGGVYLGVGPEQNFTYIVALQPKLAFIVDIRRQALLQHLLYKAVFEMADTRADFLSLLFARPRPPGLEAGTSPQALFAAYDSVAVDSMMFYRTLALIKDRLVRTHGFTLSDADLQGIQHVLDVIYFAGPRLNYSSPSGNGMLAYTVLNNNGVVTTTPSAVPGSYARFGPVRPDFASLMAQTDSAGSQRSFLATEANYRWMRDLEMRNMLVPVVGDFAGPKALRSVGRYLRDRGAVVTAIYTSNVEQYLFQNRVWGAYYTNVATLPVDSSSTFIRALVGGGYRQGAKTNGLTSSLGSVIAVIDAMASGSLQSYADLVRLSHQ